MTPYEVAQHMMRARSPDGTPVDAGLILAYLEHEAALAGVPVERLGRPIRSYELQVIDLAKVTARGLEAIERAFGRAVRVIGDALRGPPTQSDFALAE